MLAKNSEDLVREFYELNKDKFPEVTSFEKAKNICYGQFRFLKEEMENGELCEIRFKYLGSFKVYQGRAEALLRNIEERVALKKISRADYLRVKAMLIKFLKNE
jgi:hypothetical protein